jgi:transposase
LHLRHIDELSALIGEVEARIEAMMTSFQLERDLLLTIPGLGKTSAAVVISEIGIDMAAFPSADHLAAWAGLAPANNQSGGRRRPAGRRHGNERLVTTLVECAHAASRTRTRVGAQFHKLVRRFGGHRSSAAKGKAAVAVAHTLILIIYHVLDQKIPYQELGHDFYTKRQDPERYKDKLVARLKSLGYDVEVRPSDQAA